MSLFSADLHIHSRFSRATSKALNLRLLAAWARVKGLDVLGTGDFTHPQWVAEMQELLEPDETGLFTLKNERHLEREIPFLEGYPLAGHTRFMLSAEISSIYKRDGKVRKIHNLIFMPDLESVQAFNTRLAQIGNLASDGRPILGLDARDLLEITLETHDLAFLVPAHIWTPWFSLFGSQSGFDSVEECFADLAGEIFAMETGLSSDPEMNWHWSALDRYRMISNSDAHSGEKLGREANLFSGPLSYEGIYRALRGESLGHKFLGTLEFFPEEGKYHLDGHRKCNIRLLPHETAARDGICPVCGKALTAGVLSRILALADRNQPVQPPSQPGFVSLVPLAELLSEILGKGPQTKTVRTFYAKLIARWGSELAILQDIPGEELAKVSAPLAEGLARMRRGEVIREAGFDGQFGTICVFTPQERQEIQGGKTLVTIPVPQKKQRAAGSGSAPLAPAADLSGPSGQFGSSDSSGRQVQEGTPAFNARQQEAIEAGPEPVLVLAGPGTGKTRTLTGRIRHLLTQGETPRHILALTFTRHAAQEIKDRLLELAGKAQALPRADTLHALAFECWTTAYGQAPVILPEESAKRLLAEATGLTGTELRNCWQKLQYSRECLTLPDEIADHAHAYAKTKESWNLADYTDLLTFWLEQIEARIWTNPFTQILVDEVQDLSPLQLALIKALTGKQGQGFFAIGDPDQSIYSFRGAVADVQKDLQRTWKNLRCISLDHSYRCTQTILHTASGLSSCRTNLTDQTYMADMAGQQATQPPVHLFTAPDATQEAVWIGRRISELLGSTSHTITDAAGEKNKQYSPGDIAVLVRLKALVPVLHKVLDSMGLPVSTPETEAFWSEPRVATILEAAGRTVGIAGQQDTEPICPDTTLMQGPAGIAAWLGDTAPFDRLFWTGPAFRALQKAFDEHGNWPDLLNWIHLQTAMDIVRTRAEKVQIMTLHAAKGLEFEAVFLPALEEGLLPFFGMDFLTGQQEQDTPGIQDTQEEQRLLYVGMTRARSLLYLSHAKKRRLYGQQQQLPVSRLLSLFSPESFDKLEKTTITGKTVQQEKQLGLL